MGFPQEIAKNALSKVNPGDVSAACEAAIKLKINEPGSGATFALRKLRILSWACPRCTFINQEGCPSCEMCTAVPPLEAYAAEKTEEEKKREDEEAKLKAKEEARKIEEKKRLDDEAKKRRVEDAELKI